MMIIIHEKTKATAKTEDRVLAESSVDELLYRCHASTIDATIVAGIAKNANGEGKATNS